MNNSNFVPRRRDITRYQKLDESSDNSCSSLVIFIVVVFSVFFGFVLSEVL